MLDLTRKRLDHLVDGHELPAGFPDVAPALMIVATEPFQVVPDTDGIGADNELFALILTGNSRKFSNRMSGIFKEDIKPRRRILPNETVGRLAP